ncbi:hypothetical protein GXW74_14600 [Roseomonas eburnea]|uniref:Uncharacterized protein n=1 Tax=Neoroseomonas eburnea TaxID=1346889 RepID=A0A9X9XDD5_9PROT|nr:hypothetical protein [Neoroseomonas eburnea]MBR0681721.1 hypothetical protein [Neoroseomonas eburnea]
MPSDLASPPPRAEAAPARGAELRGLVDNAAADKLYGWAWNAAAPQERVAIELRLGSATVFRTVADFARADLAKAGIGDGSHAFEIPLEPEWAQRRSDLAVVARAADGTEVPMPMRIPRPPAEERTEAAPQRLLEAVAAGQRRLHEELRAIAARVPEAGERAALEALERGQRDLTERLATLTLWLTRLDERLAAIPVAPPRPPRRRAGGWTFALVVLLAAIGVAALVASRDLGVH